jgi:bifunctional DNA-binding transcriptional regulator/antitoxin component of YhaV-PrlF toxin-antitoxin module
MAVRVMKVSSKGQVTLPREVRKILGSDVVTYDVRDGRVLLLPVKDVGGSLKEFAGRPSRSFRRAREKAWEDVAREKAGRADT